MSEANGSSENEVDAEKFFKRVTKIRDDWLAHKSTTWSNADALCIPKGKSSEDVLYSKSVSMHLYLFGKEFTDTIIFITKKTFYFMATKKKINHLQHLKDVSDAPITITFIEKVNEEGALKESLLNIINKIKGNSPNTKLGCLTKWNEYEGTFIPLFKDTLETAMLDTVDISGSIGSVLAIKDDDELELCKRAAVLTNKVMKHGFVSKMQDILESDSKVGHDKIAQETQEVIENPSKIGLNVPQDQVDVCYFPIVQSGGKYDLRISAETNKDVLQPDVIVASLGARYKDYCASVARTFLVDAPERVNMVYKRLLDVYDHALSKCTVGTPFKDVMISVKKHLESVDKDLIGCLPKNLGFVTGLEFRDSSHILNEKNSHKFANGMTLILSIGFHNVPLKSTHKLKAAPAPSRLNAFSLLISDTIRISDEGAVILTKYSKELNDVSFELHDGDDDEEEVGHVEDDEGRRRSTRNREEKEASAMAAIQRKQRQRELIEKRLRDARKLLENGGEQETTKTEEIVEATDLQTYKSVENYPRDYDSWKIRIDMDNECVIVPVFGHPIPFHISMIKNIVMPDPDRATYLRINFFTPGVSLPKDANKNTALLLQKYSAVYGFIKDLQLRSLDGKNLLNAYRLYNELRKRVRAREQKKEQERDLVVQAKLIRIKDERVPRLQDIKVRPTLSGKQSTGTLESHQNGIRFASSRGETLDILYTNIKHAVYQPCQKSHSVIIHFNLKDGIMIGKKKQTDVQFYTTVIETSMDLDGGRRSSYDPDEMEEEQREREMKKRLNNAFKDFCKKVERVAKHYQFSVEFDRPYVDLGFYGNCHKEMVFIQPTSNCLINVTETPNYLIDLSDIEHVHFERAGSQGVKNFDMTMLFKNVDRPPSTITIIETKYLDMIEDWLTDIGITFSVGSISMQWNKIIEELGPKDNPYFWSDTDEDGQSKPIGWMFLDMFDPDVEEGEGEGSEGGESEYESVSSDSSESASDDEDDEESYDEEDESDGYADEESEEEGQSWEELERDAVMQDRMKRSTEHEEDSGRKKKARR